MIGDDIFEGASGSHRRFFGTVAHNDDHAAFLRAQQGAQAAQNAPYGSIAQRNDPNRYGSIESRLFPGSFGPDGSFNPQSPQNQNATTAQGRRSLDPSGSQQQPMMPFGGISPYLLGALLAKHQQPSANPTDALTEDDDGRN